MAINPIDTEVFVQNLKQAYTILRQNILICNTMVEMINNFNSLNTTGEENTTDIAELQNQVSSINGQLTELESQVSSAEQGISRLQRDLGGLTTYVYGDMSTKIENKVDKSEIQNIVYGTGPTANELEYKVLPSDDQSTSASDRSIPTTAWVAYKLFKPQISFVEQIIYQDLADDSIPIDNTFNKYLHLTKTRGTYQLKENFIGLIYYEGSIRILTGKRPVILNNEKLIEGANLISLNTTVKSVTTNECYDSSQASIELSNSDRILLLCYQDFIIATTMYDV